MYIRDILYIFLIDNVKTQSHKKSYQKLFKLKIKSGSIKLDKLEFTIHKATV